MPDDSYMGSVLNWLKGTPAAPAAPTVNYAPPLSSYPSSADADYARNYGFSQGAEAQPFLDNQTAHVVGHNVSIPSSISPNMKVQKTPAPPQQVFLPTPASGTLSSVVNAVDNPNLSQLVNLSDPNNGRLQGSLNNVVMRAGLAANRIPIAAVGFDPNRAALDPAAGDSRNISGLTSINGDHPIYANVDPNDPSTLVHESIHRGMEKLNELYPDKMRAISPNLPDQEMMVRFLMQSQAGDPEAADTGAGSQMQRRNATNMMDTTLYPHMADNYRNAINQAQELAIDAMKNRGKRVGPQ